MTPVLTSDWCRVGPRVREQLAQDPRQDAALHRLRSRLLLLGPRVGQVNRYLLISTVSTMYTYSYNIYSQVGAEGGHLEQ